MPLPRTRNACLAAALTAALALPALPLPAQAPASTLPPTAPTSATQVAPIAAGPSPAHTVTKAHAATVRFEDGQLYVQADDSSLNQILHAVSRRTGMTITGGVADQRIFGEYGPAAPSVVLATLLDGTGVNMLLRETASHDPVELVLTARDMTKPVPSALDATTFDSSDEVTGNPAGPRPPNLGVRSNEPFADRPGPPSRLPGSQPGVAGAPQQQPPTPQNTPPQQAQAPATPTQIPQPANNPLGNPNNTSPTASTLNTTTSVPIDSLPTPSTATPPPAGIVDAPNPPPAGSTSDANGTLTVDSVLQQLQALQKKNAAANAATGAATPQPATPTPPATTPPQD